MKLLLDEHLSPKLVEIIRALASRVDIESIYRWQSGRFINRPDDMVLRAAAEDGRTLVTFDVRTIPSILVEFGISGEEHAGVIFVSIKSYPQNDFKGLAHAIVALAGRSASDNWTNRVVYLTRD